MNDSRTYTIFPSNLDLSKTLASCLDVPAELGFSESSHGNSRFSLELGKHRRLSSSSAAEFRGILPRFSNPTSVRIYACYVKDETTRIEIGIAYRPNSVEIDVDSSEIERIEHIHSRLQEIFKASYPKIERSPELDKWNLKKTVFLAHRFDTYGNELAARLRLFLRRCGFSVLEGEGYEAQNIPEKVSSRIDQQDILIALLTPGSHVWVTSEASYAKGRNKFIVFLCESGATVEKGIFGQDYEHLEFPKDNVEKSFSGLLYTLPI